MKEDILNEFQKNLTNYEFFRQKVLSLISDLLYQEKLVVHNLSGRVKDFDSLSNKIDKKIDKYSLLKDITDIVGIRIISHLESDVDIIEKLIRKEFIMDEENSVDKRELNYDQFGYRSLHLVVSINDTRADLPEYSVCKEIKCEIQIRSILQHAWAEIEHDLGYKGKSQIPDQYKRDFNRLSALLETADKEFDRLKNDLSLYENSVSNLIISEPQNVGINKASLQKFIVEDNTLKEIKDYLANKMHWIYLDSTEGIDELISTFSYFKIKSIKDLKDSLIENKNIFLKFVDIFTNGFNYSEISQAIVIYYFQHFLAAKSENESFIEGYLNFESNIDALPEDFIKIYKQAKKFN